MVGAIAEIIYLRDEIIAKQATIKRTHKLPIPEPDTEETKLERERESAYRDGQLITYMEIQNKLEDYIQRNVIFRPGPGGQ
jgi:hypothetical protein